MPTHTLIRWSAPLFALGAIAFAVFIIVSNGQFAGAQLGLSTHHHVAHVSHFFSAIFFLFGIIGFYEAHRVTSGVFGFVSFLVAMVGTALFCGTGVITAFVWRTISANAPQLVEMNGAFFQPPLPIIFIATVTFSLGHVLLGITAIRVNMLPRLAAGLYIVGALMVLLPPPPWGPVPYVVLDVGATLFMIGAVWMALRLWNHAKGVEFSTAETIRVGVGA